MKKSIIFVSILIFVVLAACAPASGGQEGDANAGEVSTGGSSGESAQVEAVRLSDDYADALSVQGQLAAGTLLLEETDQAVDEALAAELLPLWQALQSLSASDTASSVEIEAVLVQIQETMAGEQVAAIAAMNLTEESLTTMMEAGQFSFGSGGFGRGFDQGGNENNQSGGEFPGGGFPGGGQPGGGFGGGPGGGFQGADPDAIATRQAEFANAGPGAFLERGLTGAVVRLLGTKTGEVSADQFGGIFGVVFEVVGEATGLSSEEIRARTDEGVTLAEVITEGGGDVDAVREALIEAFSELPNADEMDVETLAAQWLGLEE